MRHHLLCKLFGHKFLEEVLQPYYEDDIYGAERKHIWHSTKPSNNCRHCGLSKQECGILTKE